MTSALRTLALAATTALFGTALMAPAQAAAPVDLQPEDRAAPRRHRGGPHRGRRLRAGRSHGRRGRQPRLRPRHAPPRRHQRRERRRQVPHCARPGGRHGHGHQAGISFFELELSTNGRYFVHPGRATRKTVPIRVFSSRTGKLKTEQDFAGSPLRDGHGRPPGDHVDLGQGPHRGTKSWDTTTDEVTTITRPPRQHGRPRPRPAREPTPRTPTRAAAWSSARSRTPPRRLWKSCTERVEAFSPDGKRMATISILSDGIGPSVVQEREIDGSPLADLLHPLVRPGPVRGRRRPAARGQRRHPVLYGPLQRGCVRERDRPRRRAGPAGGRPGAACPAVRIWQCPDAGR